MLVQSSGKQRRPAGPKTAQAVKGARLRGADPSRNAATQPANSKRRSRAPAALVLILGIAAGLILCTGRAHAAPSHDELVVHFYDVGQGSCAFIECPDAFPILDDCGSKPGSGGRASHALTNIREELGKYNGTNNSGILTVLLTHVHTDHHNLLTDPQQRVFINDVKAVYFGGAFRRFNSAAQTWISSAARHIGDQPSTDACSSTALVSCLNPNESAFPWTRVACGRARVDLLTVNAFEYNSAHPRAGQRLDGTMNNGDSMIVRISYLGASIVIAGDAEEVSQFYAIANSAADGHPLAHTTVLLAPHHGGATHGSNNGQWVAEVSPKVVVFSANEKGRYGHPSCRTVDLFDAREDDRIPAPFKMRCWIDKQHSQVRTVHHRLLATEDTGDVTVHVASGGVSISCEKTSAACPALLDAGSLSVSAANR